MSTFSARVSGSGDCQIPGQFGDSYRKLSAALDWARVFSEQLDNRAAAVELEAAADAADHLAAVARDYARRARNLETTREA